MSIPLRVLIVEDSEDDTILVVRELQRGGYEPTFERVDTPEAMNAALEQQTWDIVLADYAMPLFSMPAALAMVKEKGLDLPFIIVSGAIGEEAAVAAMQAGAYDYVMKSNLARLAPAVERELREAEVRRERKRAEEALRESEEHYSALVGNLTDAVFTFKGGVITWCNDRVEEIYGYPKEELLGKNASFFYPSDISPSEFTRRVAAAIKKHGLVRGASKFQRRDGSFVDIEYSLSQIPGKDPLEIIAVARDVTERKRAEETLRESEGKFRRLVEDMSDGYCVVQGSTIVFANARIAEMFGYTQEEVIGKTLRKLLPSEIVKELVKAHARRHRGESVPPQYETTLARKDQTKCSVEFGARLIEYGGQTATSVVVRDITERKQMEEALRQSEEKMRAQYKSIPIPTYTWKRVEEDFVLVDCNDAAVAITKGGVANFIGGKATEMYQDRPDIVEELSRCFAEKTLIKGEMLYRYKITGESKHLAVTYVFVPPNMVMVHTDDVTERKQAEEAVRRNEEYLRVLLENALDVIVVLNSDTTIRFKTPSFERMFGEARHGKNPFEAVHPDDIPKAADAFQQLMQNPGATVHMEIRGQHRDGSWRTFEVLGRNLLDNPAVAGIVANFRDITDHKRMEQQLQLTGRLAAVGELAAGIAHELNNPLTAVQAFAQFLTDRDNLDESVKSDVETIYREAQRATRITASLLRFARRHKPEKRLISINEVIGKALELHAYRLKLSNIEVLVELAPDLPMTMADSDQMHQAFVNIISNAEQAMTEAHSKGKLSVKTQRAGEMVQAAFTDDGPGIPEDDLKSIFDPFFTTKGVGEGTGLGLSICYGIVEEHGGHMYARSKPGKGATFVVEIPIVSEGQPIAEHADSTEVQKA